MTASVALSFARAVVTAPRTTFTDAVRDYQDEVYGVALRITGDRESALDVMSTTFLKAYRAFARYDQTRPIRFWLLRIATNEAISHARRAGRELRRRTAMESVDTVVDATAAPEAALLAREERGLIRAAVAQLPELYRSVIVLRYFNELSIDEIAAVTERPASTVGVQLLRGRALLRRALEGRA